MGVVEPTAVFLLRRVVFLLRRVPFTVLQGCTLSPEGLKATPACSDHFHFPDLADRMGGFQGPELTFNGFFFMFSWYLCHVQDLQAAESKQTLRIYINSRGMCEAIQKSYSTNAERAMYRGPCVLPASLSCVWSTCLYAHPHE